MTTKLKFPTHLRKMWSGSEVQEWLDKQQAEQEPVAHMYPSDLEKFETNETYAYAYSVAVGNPDERSVPLYAAHVRTKNLTDDEIRDALDGCEYDEDTPFIITEARAFIAADREKNK